jgi:hypothetical protein
MTASFSLFTVALGTVLARLAERSPVRSETIETAAGFMLLGGFAAVGCALPML